MGGNSNLPVVRCNANEGKSEVVEVRFTTMLKSHPGKKDKFFIRVDLLLPLTYKSMQIQVRERKSKAVNSSASPHDQVILPCLCFCIVITSLKLVKSNPCKISQSDYCFFVLFFFLC